MVKRVILTKRHFVDITRFLLGCDEMGDIVSGIAETLKHLIDGLVSHPQFLILFLIVFFLYIFIFGNPRG